MGEPLIPTAWLLFNGQQKVGICYDWRPELETPPFRTEPLFTREQVQQEPLCACKDRPASECPGEWEPGCDLGANPKYARAAPQEPVGEVDPPNMSVTWYGDSLKKIDALRTKPFKPVKLYVSPQELSQEPVAKIVNNERTNGPFVTIEWLQWPDEVGLKAGDLLYAAPQPQAPSSDDVRDKRIAELEAELSAAYKHWQMALNEKSSLMAALADARDKALEEAAKVCDGITHQYTSSGGHAADRCAAAIRALRTTSEK